MDLQYDAGMLGKALGEYMNKVRNNCVRPTRKHGVVHADVTNIIELFKHLQIDEDYKIIARYQDRGMTISGDVFAVKKGQEVYDINYNVFSDAPTGFKVGQYPPMEVIFCDGTPEGYLEIAIFNETMEHLSLDRKNPVKSFVCFDETIRENSKPFLIMPNNWLPKYYVDCFGYKILLTYEYDYLNGISLCEYLFSNGVGVNVNNLDSTYRSHVPEMDKRFSKDKQCCIFQKRQIAVRDGDKAFDIII